MDIRIRIDTRRLRIQEIRVAFLKEMVKELRTTGLEIETDAKMKITTDQHVDTGRLRSSLHTEYQGRTNHSYRDDIGNTFDGTLGEGIGNKYHVIVGTNVIYSRRIERIDSYLFWSFEKSAPGLQRRLRNILNSL